MFLELQFLLFKCFRHFAENHLGNVMAKGAMTISNDDEPFLLWVKFVILGLYYVNSVDTERVLVYFRCTCPSYIACLSEVTDLLDEEMAMFSDVDVRLLLRLSIKL